jgi:hypothetical protein
VDCKFDNLLGFFNYIDFCPLCKSRLVPTITIAGCSECVLGNKRLFCYNTFGNFTVDIVDNGISKTYKSKSRPKITQIVVGKQCRKYHFFYNGVADLYKKELLVKNISLDKYHFIRIFGEDHFTINGSFISNSTNIRITRDFKTQEFIMPLIQFDLFSKKKIDNRLKKIQLLK